MFYRPILTDGQRLLRIFAKTKKFNDCLLFTGYIRNDGYGMIRLGKKCVFVHRFVYACVRGVIKNGLMIDHLCRNRSCVNPQHLELVTNKENILRGVGPTAINSRKTTCKRGHGLIGDNVVITSEGNRRCKVCRNKQSNNYYRKKHE